MAINRNYTDKAEWQRGYDIGHEGIVKALDENQNKTKQGIYIAGRMFNKKMADEHVTKDLKSDDFRAGMETATQEVFQEQWINAPNEQPTIFSVPGMDGLVGMHIPGGMPSNVPIKAQNISEPVEKKPSKKPGRFDDIIF
jgi:hypothetical protein